ncbi:MAG: aminopeptidase P family protein [Balneolales bacterium]
MFDEHRSRLLTLFEEEKNSVIYLKGGAVQYRYNTDFEYPFRQESHFLYLTGVNEPDMAAIFHCGSGEYCLVVPRRDTQFAIWMGYIRSLDDYSNTYKPDQVIYSDDVSSWLSKAAPKTVHCLPGAEDDVKQLGFTPETGYLQDALAYCRVIKSKDEINCMKKAAEVANGAHLELMQSVRPGIHEYEMKAIFDYHTTRCGLIHAPYSGIFASGRGSAILHYTENSKMLHDGELILVDAGAEYKGYAADVTRTYPVGGTFSPLQSDLYDIVLEAQSTALNMIRPGNKMEDLHLAAARIIITGLRDCRLIHGDIEDMMEENIFALFFPHGLGHFLGLDTHDVGGYPKGTAKIDRPGLRFLRARRTFESGMVLTIEPGLYFIPALLEPAFQEKKSALFLNAGRLQPLYDFGGIRIEDNVIVRKDGMENLTTIPKSRRELQDIIYK